VNLRIGPYVCAEWTYGGIPVWVGLKPGAKMRCTNKAWQDAMQAWFQTVVAKAAPFFAPNGGPVVMVQVENELHTDDTAYVNWCGTMAQSVLAANSVSVPLIMCNGQTSNLTINTCNGPSCVDFIESNGQSGTILKTQPALWTEDEGGFQLWGESPSFPTNYFWGRSIAEQAYETLRWFARGGSHVNYYMWTGGNNIARWAGNGITNFYSVDAPLCPDLLRHEVKWAHFQAMHAALARHAGALLHSSAQLGNAFTVPYFDGSNWVNGTQQLGWRYTAGASEKEGIVFIENQFSGQLFVQYQQRQYPIQGTSVLMLDAASGDVVFDSAAVTQGENHRVNTPVQQQLTWRVWQEPLQGQLVKQQPAVQGASPVEQGAAAARLGDGTFNPYMVYTTHVALPATPAVQQIVINTWQSTAATVFLNNSLQGSAGNAEHDGTQNKLTVMLSVPQGGGVFTLDIALHTLGMNNFFPSGANPIKAGIMSIDFPLGGSVLPSTTAWSQRKGLLGEALGAFKASTADPAVKWGAPSKQPATAQAPLAWIWANFTTPAQPKAAIAQRYAVALDLSGLSRGQFWVNGVDLGVFWNIERNDGSGRSTQRLYHVPLDVLAPVGSPNELVAVAVAAGSAPEEVVVVVSSMQQGPPSPPVDPYLQSACDM